jgi:EAL and modified HD-GYP domain-containing signal transduction protein
LFSLLDAILDMPMTELLERVSLPDRIREALLGGDSKLGQVLKLVQAYESANWNVCDQLAQALGMQESTLSELYLASVAWTTEFAGLAAHGS